MNQVLKTILQVAEQVAVKAVPGGNLVDAGIHAIVDHHDDSAATADGIANVAEGAIESIEAIKGVDIADEQMFRAGVALTQQGLALVKRSLVSKDGTPAVVPA